MNGQMSEHIATLVMGDKGKPRKVGGREVETPPVMSRARVDAALELVLAVAGDQVEQGDEAKVAIGTLEAFQRTVGSNGH